MIKRDKHIDVRIELLYMYHISMDMERQLFCKQTKSTIKPILFHVMGRESCDDYLQDGLLCLKEE